MNAATRLLLGAILLMSVPAAQAEGGCPPGMIPYQGTSTQSCGPIPNSGVSTARPASEWLTRWGAIASDGSLGVMGAVDSRSSKKQAEREAISECKSRGGVTCSIQLSYYNQCVVTIQGSRTANNTRAATIEEATAIGMRTCTSQGDDDCKVYYKACSMPVRVR